MEVWGIWHSFISRCTTLYTYSIHSLIAQVERLSASPHTMVMSRHYYVPTGYGDFYLAFEQNSILVDKIRCYSIHEDHADMASLRVNSFSIGP